MAVLTSVDLSTYTRVGRYDLPEPTRTIAPANSLLAQEVSAVTYNWDTDTLFVVGDGSTSIVQVTKTGQLINSMTLAPGNSPQGTDFYDTEGLTYLGGGRFVIVEERDRQVSVFTYVPGTTLTKSAVQTVKLGTTVGNIGIEGISYDPQTGGFIAVKEISPSGIFQTNVNFALGTATNGSATTENSVNLFDPAKTGLLDFADIFSLSNLSTLSGQADSSHLLVLSQESGKILNVDRNGTIFSSLTIQSDAGNPLSVANQQHEGLTMDNNGFLYVTSENGGGDIDHPQLWVYAPNAVLPPVIPPVLPPVIPPSTANLAPTAVSLGNPIVTIAENTSTINRVKVADITITDDGKGTNNLTITGADASAFEIVSNALYVKAGVTLDYETKNSYSIVVAVDDPTVGLSPDAVKTFILNVTDVYEPPIVTSGLAITEVAPWASGNTAYAADWFEVTNVSTSAVDITGWKFDDNSNSYGSAVTLNGITSIAAGQSVIFIETTTQADAVAGFKSAWFGGNPPPNLTIGTYSGSGVGLSTGGDEVNLFDTKGNRVTGVGFGPSTTGISFDNKAAIGSSSVPVPLVTALSAIGSNGTFLAADGIETGSPGITSNVNLIISEISPWSSGNSPYAADWFEVTNNGINAVDITGWKFDDNSNSFGSAVALTGISSIGAGQSVVFIETTLQTDAKAAFQKAWFGNNVPKGFTIGSYSGSGVGLSTGGDEVNLFDASGTRITGIGFGPSTTGSTFENRSATGTTIPVPIVSTLSVLGSNGAVLAATAPETGSPGGANGIFAGPGDDVIYGGPGNDLINGGDGNDRIYGNGGSDNLNGGAGNDDVAGGLGNDILSGGAGDDLILSAGGNDTVFAGTGDDRVFLGAGNDQIAAGEGNNVVYSGDGTNSITAGAGNDKIYGNAGDDTVIAGNGNNEVFVGEGNNRVTTGSGDDLIGLGSGNDIINAGDGMNRIFAGDGNNQITTGIGDDLIYSGSGNDIILTGAGNDLIYAGLGNNQINSGTGTDLVCLSDSFNTLTLNEGLGSMTVLGFGADDRLTLGAGLVTADLSFARVGNNTLINKGTDLLATLQGTLVQTPLFV
jgi:uncharacterized protein YjiK